MGRPRAKNKDLPPGVYCVKGRYYVRPVNEPMRRVFSRALPGKKSAPLGADKLEARKRWVQLFVAGSAAGDGAPGTVGELLERYALEVVPTLHGASSTPDVPHKSTAGEHSRYIARLREAFGAMRYARSEAEAGLGKCLRSMHITQWLRAEEKRPVLDRRGKVVATGRPVAGNKAIQCFSRVFRLAKVEWGLTEYNPCLQVEYNIEAPRGVYVTDAVFMRIYDKAPPVLQCMMDLAQMHGARRGMLLKLNLSNITDEGLLLPINKKKRSEAQRLQLVRWSDDLHRVVERALALRAQVRGGQRDVMDAPGAPLFLTRHGKRMSVTGFNSLWQRTRIRAGFTEAHAVHFHDIKAKAVSDSPNELDAMNRGGHLDLRTTRRVYRRKPTEVVPLPSVSGKKSA